MTNRDKLNKLYMKDCQEIIAMSNNELVGKAMINCGFSTKFCDFILSLYEVFVQCTGHMKFMSPLKLICQKTLYPFLT